MIILIYLYYQNRKLAQLPTNSGNATSPIFELSEEENKGELIADRDAAIRTKLEAEQEVLSLNNRLKNKQLEVSRKEQEIERLKSEKNLVEVNLNQKLTEKNKEFKELQQKYSKQSQLLDTEQLECKKLEEKVENLETEIKSLKKSLDWQGPD